MMTNGSKNCHTNINRWQRKFFSKRMIHNIGPIGFCIFQHCRGVRRKKIRQNYLKEKQTDALDKRWAEECIQVDNNIAGKFAFDERFLGHVSGKELPLAGCPGRNGCSSGRYRQLTCRRRETQERRGQLGAPAWCYKWIGYLSPLLHHPWTQNSEIFNVRNPKICFVKTKHLKGESCQKYLGFVSKHFSESVWSERKVFWTVCCDRCKISGSHNNQ